MIGICNNTCALPADEPWNILEGLHKMFLSGALVWPLIEGGKGIGVSDGRSAGSWAKAGGVGTFSAVNALSYDDLGRPIPARYESKTRRGRHEELIHQGIQGGVTQARIAHATAGGNGRIHLNILWEMGGAEEVLCGILEKVEGLVHGITCGAGMPYRLLDIAAKFGVFAYPIVSSARAFSALWKRAYHRCAHALGGVVYECPWRAGGHNGLSNAENPLVPQPALPRVAALRTTMNAFGLHQTPIIMAGGVWNLGEWADWLNHPDLQPIAFQFGTRPLMTVESPVSDAWKSMIRHVQPGDVSLMQFSPTGFYASALRNDFLKDLEGRSQRQIPYASVGSDDYPAPFLIEPIRGRLVYLRQEDALRAQDWQDQGYGTALKTPDQSLVFVTAQQAISIHQDQVDCMGCLSACRFSNWSQRAPFTTGHKPDPRSFCIQKTLQNIARGEDPQQNLAFGGHNLYRFQTDPFYANGFIPTVQQLFQRILAGL